MSLLNRKIEQNLKNEVKSAASAVVLDEPTYEGSHSESRGHKVVGFEVIPLNIKHQYGNNPRKMISIPGMR